MWFIFCNEHSLQLICVFQKFGLYTYLVTSLVTKLALGNCDFTIKQLMPYIPTVLAFFVKNGYN